MADPRNPHGARQGVNERIMLRELLRRVDMMVILENKLDALVRLHTPWPPGLIGHAYQYDIASNLRPESLSGPNAGLTEVLIPAGYVTTVYDPVYKLTPDGKRYVSQASDKPTTIPAPGLPFSLVFRAEPGKEDVLLKIASAYEAASQRRVPPPNFGRCGCRPTSARPGRASDATDRARLRDGRAASDDGEFAWKPPVRPVHRAAPVLPGAVDVGRRRGLGDLAHLALGEEVHLLAHRLGLHLQLGVQLQIDRGIDGAAHVRPDHDAAVAAHQAGAALAELLGEIAALMPWCATSRSVSPNLVCWSQIGTSWPMVAHMCISGRILWPVTPYGMTPGLWLWITRHHVGPRLIGARRGWGARCRAACPWRRSARIRD